MTAIGQPTERWSLLFCSHRAVRMALNIPDPKVPRYPNSTLNRHTFAPS